jgi:hypothetical protein
MKAKDSPAPRANAGSRADFKAEQKQNNASAPDWEADAAAVWFARLWHMPTPLAHALAAPASVRGAVA